MEILNLKSLIERNNKGSFSYNKRDILESWYVTEVRSNKDYKGVEENPAKLDQNFMHNVSAREKKGSKLGARFPVAASLAIVPEVKPLFI